MNTENVLSFFKEITKIPRESGHEEHIIAYLQKFAADNGLECKTDEAGNVLITKEAAPGYENVPTIVLQSHSDMVCEKNEGVEHDFAKDPIKYIITPQQVALADARKGIDMFTNDKVNVPILGLVENMAWFTPAELPENKYYIFGKEGCKQLAEEMGVPLLGQIPVVQSICEGGDNGCPVALDDTTMTGLAFRNLAEAVVHQVEVRNATQEATRIVKTR